MPWFQEEEASWPSCPPQRAEHGQGKNSRWCLYVVTKTFDNKVSRTAGIHIAHNHNIFLMVFPCQSGRNISLNVHLSISKCLNDDPVVQRLGQQFLVIASIRLKIGAIAQDPGLEWRICCLHSFWSRSVCVWSVIVVMFPQPWNSDFVASMGSPRKSLTFYFLSNLVEVRDFPLPC